MKPIRLRIQNFISYRGRPAIIDFTDYRCLFLISGNTGAGKTTIFDAMTYALFGEISAEETNIDGSALKNGRAKCIRCENAPDGEDTIVELVFEHQGKEYRIKRGLGGRKDRSDGKTYYDKPIVEMTGGGLSLDKKAKIDEVINDMLGLDAKQWRNVVMLAQSQFMSFLKASTPERTKILNKLFDTSRFEKISQRLEEMEKEMKNNSGTDLKMLSEISRNFKFNDAETAKRFDALKETDTYAEAVNILKMFDRAIETDGIELSRISESLQTLQEESNKSQAAYNEAKNLCDLYEKLNSNETELSALLAKAEEFENKKLEADRAKKAASAVNPQYKEFQSARTALSAKQNELEEQKKKIPNLEERKDACEKELAAAKENDAEEQGLRDRIAKIEPLLSKYEELGNARNSEKKLSKDRETLSNEIESDRSKLKKAEDEKATKEKFVTENMDVGRKLESANNAEEKLEKQVLGLKKIRSDYQNLRSSENTLKESGKELEKARSKSEAAESAYEELLKKQSAHSAGLLASKLEPGCRCPVCGSLDHPSPAELSDDAPTEKEIEKAKQGQKKLKNELDDISIRHTKDSQKFDDLKAAFDNDVVEYKIEQKDDVLSAIDAKLAEYEKQRDENSALISELGKIQKAFDEANESVGSLKTQIDKLNSAIEEKEGKLKTIELDLATQRSLIDSLSKDLSEFDSKSEAEKAILDLGARADGLKKALEDANAAFNKAKEDLSVGLNKVQTLISDIENLSVTETQTRTTYETARSEAGFADEAEFLRYLKVHEHIEELESEIDGYNRNCTALRSSCDTLKTQIAERPKPENLEEYETRMKQCSAALSEANHKSGILSSCLQSNKDVRGRFDKLYQDTKKARSRLDTISELVNVYKGNKGSGVKISFNQYVLGGYLDTIVANATRRLKEMSCGRYELRRVEKATSQQGSNALDLDIYDSHNCHRRSINTLSGGEAFMTALSLSLSISDTIQSSARGKTVEGLFIDEGFGTLDDNTRNLAVNTLKQMSNDRISIGIISHVEDLKTIIEKGMEVTYNPSEGSKIRFY